MGTKKKKKSLINPDESFNLNLVSVSSTVFTMEEIPKPSVPEKQSRISNFPLSPASSALYDFISAGQDLPQLPDRKKQFNRGTDFSVSRCGTSYQYTVHNSKSEVTIEHPDLSRLASGSKPATSMFTLCLIKANEQALHSGTLSQDFVTFPLQELVDLGIYSSPRAARTGFLSGMDVLTSVKLKGKINKPKHSIDAISVLFTDAYIENGQCFVFLNPRIDWGMIVTFYSILPSTYWTLLARSNRAAKLYRYIFSQARQHTKEIAEGKSFNISFRTIHSILKLPSEVGCRKPKQYIRDPIENAIEEIEDAHFEDFGNDYLQFELHYDENANIQDYLNNGYLSVYLRGDFAEKFIEQSEKQSKEIEAYKKRKARIQDEAAIKAKAKALEEHAKREENEGGRS